MKECKCIVSITDPSDKDRFITVLEDELAEYAKTNDYLARKAKKLEAELEKAEVDFAELHEKYAMLLDKGITGAEETRAELADLYKDRDRDFYGYTTCSKCACYYIDKNGDPPSSADPTCTPCAEAEWLNIKLAELRDAVAWCRECDELYEYDRKHGIATGGGYLEFLEIVKCAEQELCRLSEGEDV